MLDKELEYTLNLAFREARAKRHEFVTVEHLLVAHSSLLMIALRL